MNRPEKDFAERNSPGAQADADPAAEAPSRPGERRVEPAAGSSGPRRSPEAKSSPDFAGPVVETLEGESEGDGPADEIVRKARTQVDRWKEIVSHLSERATKFRVEAEFMRGEAQRMMTDSRKYHRQAIDGETRFEAVINTVHEGILIVDQFGTIELANPAAEFLLGRPKRELTGAEFGSPSAREETTDITVISADGVVRLLEMRNQEIAWQDRRAQLITLHDVTSQRRQVSTAEAEVSSRDDFLAMLSYEFREPMSAIANASKWLRSQPMGPAGEAPLMVIEDHVGRLTRMLDDLFDISQIANNRLVLKRTTIDVAELISESVAVVSNITDLIKRRFRLNVPDRPMTFYGDGERLQRVLVSILLNAVELTKPSDRIVLEVESVAADQVPSSRPTSEPPESPSQRRMTEASQANDLGQPLWLKVTVSDDGLGMDAKALARLFRPFVEAPSIPREVPTGLGLAMPLSRRLVEMHGGSLTASSPGPGCGSTVAMFLPGLELRTENTNADGRGRGSVLQRPQTVLVVDKSEDIRLSIRLLLESEGHSVIEAVDGPSGLQKFIEEMPDIALIHLALDGMSGEEIARVMRPFDHRQNCRLVAMLHRGDPSQVQSAIDAGFDDFLVKPIRQQEVAQALFGKAEGAPPSS